MGGGAVANCVEALGLVVVGTVGCRLADRCPVVVLLAVFACAASASDTSRRAV